MQRPHRLPLVTWTAALALVGIVGFSGPAAGAVVLAGASRVQVSDDLLDRDDVVQRQIRKTADVRGRTVEVEAAAEKLIVVAGEGDRLQADVELKFWSNHQEWMEAVREQFDVELTETSDRITLRVVLPKKPPGKWIKKLFKGEEVVYSMTLRVTVPGGTSLEIGNRYGSIEVVGIGGPLRATNNSGPIDVRGAAGAVELENKYGDVRVWDVNGTLNATSVSGRVEVRDVTGLSVLSNQYGDIEAQRMGAELEARTVSGAIRVEDVKGATRLDGSYGDVEARRIGGTLTAATTSGAIRVEDVKGDAELSSSYASVLAERVDADLTIKMVSGNIEVTGVGGDLEIDGSYGNVVVNDVKGRADIASDNGGVTLSGAGSDVAIRCSYATVRVREVKGSLAIEASTTPVQVDSVGGSVKIETSYGGVRLEQIGGAIDVRDRNGAVSVRKLSGAALTAAHRIETTYADIDFDWPRGQGAQFRLESTYGRIVSDLEGRLDEHGSRRVIEGTAGSGEARIELSAKNGSVRLRED